LNDLTDFPGTNIFCADSSLTKSNRDAQILLTIGFSQPVKIYAVGIQAPKTGQEPAEIRLFINSLNMDFSDAEQNDPVHTIELAEKDYKEVTDQKEYKEQFRSVVKLPFVKFQKVTSLVVFVAKNMGKKEQTALSRLRIFGKPTQGLNMKDWSGGK